MADRGGGQYHGASRDQDVQDVPRDLASCRGRDPRGDPEGGGRLVAGLPLHRSRCGCAGGRAGGGGPLVDRAELPRSQRSGRNRAGATAPGVVECGSVEPQPVGPYAGGVVGVASSVGAVERSVGESVGRCRAPAFACGSLQIFTAGDVRFSISRGLWPLADSPENPRAVRQNGPDGSLIPPCSWKVQEMTDPKEFPP